MADETSQPTAPVAVAEPPSTGDSHPVDVATEAPAQDDPWAKLADADPDEIIRRFPKLQGKIGQLAQTQADKKVQATLAQQRQQQEAILARQQAAAKREELLRLAQTDPDQLATRIQTDLTQQEIDERRQSEWSGVQQQMVDQLQQQLEGVYTRPLVREIVEQAQKKGDQATLKRLNWREYPDFGSFAEAVADVVSEQKADSRAEALAQKRVAAALKEAGIESMQSDAALGVDLGLGGTAAGMHIFTRSELRDMDMPTYRKYKAAIDEQVSRGLIKDDLS